MKTVPELKFCSGTTAWALLYQGKYAGKVIANWSDNPAGSTCSASVVIWEGPLKSDKFNEQNIGRCGGMNWFKWAEAIVQCFDNAGIKIKTDVFENTDVEKEFVAWGYEICEVL